MGDSESVLGLPQGSPLCAQVHLLDKMDFSERPMGRLPSLQVCLPMCSQEGFLDLKNEKHVVFFIRAQLLLFILKYLSMGNKIKLFSLGLIFQRPYFIDPVIKPLPHEGREKVSLPLKYELSLVLL